MTGTILDEMTAMRDRIQTASKLITRCTWDAEAVKPPSGEVHAYLQPPDLDWDSWTGWSSDYTLVLAAGQPHTQAQSIPLILQAVQDLQDAGVNLQTGSAASWKLADSSNLIAAYELSVRPDGIVERNT